MDQSGSIFPRNAPIKKTNCRSLSQTGITMSRRLAAHNYQSIMVFLSNYERTNFSSYFRFSDLITDCIWIERRNG